MGHFFALLDTEPDCESGSKDTIVTDPDICTILGFGSVGNPEPFGSTVFGREFVLNFLLHLMDSGCRKFCQLFYFLLGFYSVEEIEYTTRLYRIHEAAHGIHLEAVPTEFHSLDSRYVFLLDGGLRRVCSASSFNFNLCKAVVSSFFLQDLWGGFGKMSGSGFYQYWSRIQIWLSPCIQIRSRRPVPVLSRNFI